MAQDTPTALARYDERRRAVMDLERSRLSSYLNAMVRFDCQACGACCCNTERNLAAGTREYVEVTREDRLFREERVRLRTLAERNEDGMIHMKLVGDEQRCVALEGDLGAGVGCAIYALRPAGCRNVEAGDEECMKARRLHGLPLSVREDRERTALL